MIKVGDTVQVISKDYGRYGDKGRVLDKRMTQMGILLMIKFKDGVVSYQIEAVRKVQ
jgi:hypothetical protein